MKLTRKILASVLALVMVLLMLPTAFAAEENVHVLETATDLTAFAQGDKADGATEVIHDYFTIYYSAKTKVDQTSKKTWGTEADDYYYAIGDEKVNRLSLGGKTSWSDEYVVKNAIAFTTAGDATVKIWGVSGEAGRNVTIQTDADTVIATYENTTEKNAPFYAEFALTGANTYYICNPDNNNWFLKFEVVETAAEEPAPASKTITVGERTFTAEGGKWLYNTYVNEQVAGDPSNAYMYSMIIFDKGYTGEAFNTNSYGCAIVLDQYGTLIKIYDGANGGFWTAEGKAASAHFTTATFATVAWSELQEGETLIIFPNDGASNTARKWALDLRNAGTSNPSECGKTATLEGFTFETAPVEPAGFTASLGYASGDWGVQEWSAVTTQVSGEGTYTLSFAPAGAAAGATVFVIDIVGGFAELGDLPVGELTITADGVDIPVDLSKLAVGDLESKGNYRIEIYNAYGPTAEAPAIDLSLLNFSQSLVISFTLGEVEKPVEPTVPETSVPETSAPDVTPDDGDVPTGGDAFGIVVALMAASGIALVALKKKEN